MAHMRGDAATQALLADSSTSEFAAVRTLFLECCSARIKRCEPGLNQLRSTPPFSLQARIEEILDGVLSSEREATVTRLAEALTAREVELRAVQR